MLILFVSELQYYLTKEVSSSTRPGYFMSSVHPHDLEKPRMKPKNVLKRFTRHRQTCCWAQKFRFLKDWTRRTAQRCWTWNSCTVLVLVGGQWQVHPITWFLADDFRKHFLSDWSDGSHHCEEDLCVLQTQTVKTLLFLVPFFSSHVTDFTLSHTIIIQTVWVCNEQFLYKQPQVVTVWQKPSLHVWAAVSRRDVKPRLGLYVSLPSLLQRSVKLTC